MCDIKINVNITLLKLKDEKRFLMSIRNTTEKSKIDYPQVFINEDDAQSLINYLNLKEEPTSSGAIFFVKHKSKKLK